MRARLTIALVAGLLAGAAVAGLPALAADASVAVSGTHWSPSDPSIGVGEHVTFTNSTGIPHSLEFEDGTITGESTGTAWSRGPITFDTAGTYRFRCTVHSTNFESGMVGAV